MKLGVDMTTNVTVLRPKDVLHLDSAPIEAMYRAMGPDQAAMRAHSVPSTISVPSSTTCTTKLSVPA